MQVGGCFVPFKKVQLNGLKCGDDSGVAGEDILLNREIARRQTKLLKLVLDLNCINVLCNNLESSR